jgi:hypothetical protein
MWITVGPEVEPDGEVRVQEFPGGLYAVTRCKGVETITATWKRLVAWLTESKYKHADHQWLEEHLTPMGTPYDELTLDLYAPDRGIDHEPYESIKCGRDGPIWPSLSCTSNSRWVWGFRPRNTRKRFFSLPCVRGLLTAVAQAGTCVSPRS